MSTITACHCRFSPFFSFSALPAYTVAMLCTCAHIGCLKIHIYICVYVYSFQCLKHPSGGSYFHRDIASRKMDCIQFINKVIEDLKTIVPIDEERTAFTGEYKHMIEEAHIRYVYECADSHRGQYFLQKVIMALVHDWKNCTRELADIRETVRELEAQPPKQEKQDDEMRQEYQAQVDQIKDMETEFQKLQKAHKELKDKHATLLQTMYSNDKHMEKEYEKLQNAHTWLKNNHATLLQTMYSNDKEMEEEYQKLQKAHTELKDRHATLLQTMDSNDKNEPKKVARKRWNAEVFKHMEANAKKQRCVLSC